MAPLFRGLDTGRVDGDADVKRLQARGDRVVNLGSAGHNDWSRAGLMFNVLELRCQHFKTIANG